MDNLLFARDAAVPQRSMDLFPTDLKALHAIVQAAVDVELFTIPLYMTSLYSLQGMHQINSKGNNFYEGRTWPGMSPTAQPQTGNQKAFNAVFSVFVAEMLHLQIVSNMAKVLKYDPQFTCMPLQDSNYGWQCYGDDKTILPHIIDLQDTIAPYNKMKVKLGPMNEEQLNLFLAIEQTDKDAQKIIHPDKLHLYIEQAPFATWENEGKLPLFGSIGNMYLQLWNYLSIEYVGGKTLWDLVLAIPDNQALVQREVFNPGRLDEKQVGKDEYPHMPTSVLPDRAKMLDEVLNMINGITDQGEGEGVVSEIKARAAKSRNVAAINLTAVSDQFRPSCPVMKKKYPSYSATGSEVESAKAEARHHFGAADHFETFGYVMDLFKGGELYTWDQWHADGNKWTPELLQTPAYDPARCPKLPSTGDVSGALNRLKLNDTEANYDLFSRTSAGAIAGVTRVLNNYFKNPGVDFPYPSMGGSGDRVSICWAVFGKAPDLSLGVAPAGSEPLDRNKHIYHACQGLNFDESIHDDPSTCAQVEIFHTCKGSNICKGEGGCGFVQSTKGGSGCNSAATFTFKTKIKEDSKNQTFSPPADNACGSLGGCAVPISASQMYPALGENDVYRMQLNTFDKNNNYQPEPFQMMYYDQGDLVYDVAWKAYTKVLKEMGKDVPEKPKPSDLRLAFPPST